MVDPAPTVTERPLLVEHRGPVAVLTLNRPRSKNALDAELIRLLGAELERVAGTPEIRVVVLTGAGGAFSSGADLRAGMVGADPNIGARMDAFHAIIRSIVGARQPFIAAVDGPAVGFGCDIALSCDLRVLSTRGYLQEIFVKIGLMPDGGGSFWVPRLVGLGRAMEYLLLGTRIDANLAKEVGLANRVVEPDALLGAAVALAEELAKGPPLAQERIKRSVRASLFGSLDDALAREKKNQLELLQSKDLVEGVLAWSERRPPAFKGE